MRLSKIFFLTASVVLALVLSTSLMFADQQHGAGIELRVKDAATGSDTVYFGYGWPNPLAPRNPLTYGVDADTIFLLDYGFGVTETSLPPPPPDGVFDVRFVDSRSGAGASLDQGIANNFHVGALTDKKDTFKLALLGSLSSGGAFPITLTWTIPNNVVFVTLTLKYTDADDAVQTIDMLTTSTVDIPNPDANKVTIISNAHLVPDGVEAISNVVPEAFALNQNYPNPFNPITNFSFAVKQASDVTIAVYDILGKKIATITEDHLAAGSFNATWNGTNDNGISVASGTYYIRMNARYQEAGGESNEFVSVQKVMLMK